MAVEFKDYYKTLGVERTASEDDLRKAFRKLARQYHPDVAKDKAQAENKFKEINEAYEVLSDSEKRKKYDTLGADWKGGFAPPPGTGRNYRTHTGRSGGSAGAEDFEFGGTGFSDFFEQFFGSKGRGGAGQRGSPFEQDVSQRGHDLESDLMVTLEETMHGAVRPISLRRNLVCEQCHGMGQMQNRACPACGGTGQIARTEKYQVKIPAGVRGGQKLRLAGQGEAGAGNGSRGDLYLRVKFAAHPDFRVEGGNIFYDLDLAPWEAVLGTSVSIPTLKTPVNIKIPPGTQDGQRLRVKERGLPSRDGKNGDLYVVAQIVMPKEITERERELWEKLARESKFNPRD
ncbi:MAG: DnaJ C-terminal domain-containing protein [Verrucomicrobiota bacterium]